MHLFRSPLPAHPILAFILGFALASCQSGPTAPISPTFRLSTKSLVFSNAVEKPVTITNITSDPIEWRILTTTASWVTATPISGNLGPNSSNTFVVRVDRNAVPTGNHAASLQVGASSYTAALDVGVEDGVPAKALLLPSAVTIPAQQSSAAVEIVNTGGADLTWSLDGPSWTSVSPSSGTLQPGGRRQVAITVDRSNLTGGQYIGSLELLSNGGSGVTQVMMEVEEVSGLRIEPSTLDFGGAATSLTVNVVNEGDQALAWSVKPGAGWVAISQSSGNLPPRLGQKLTVEVSRSGLSHGTNQAPLLFTTSRGSVSATVLATVVPAGGPGVPSTTPPQMSVTPVALDFGGT